MVTRILRAEGDWQAGIASALDIVPRPIAVDPRLAPRRVVPDPADPSLDDPRRWDRSHFPTARQAATLLLMYPHHGELLIPLTVRHHALPDHPGEISLPGGAVDPEDASLEATALRETAEEVGLDPASVRVVGRLDPVWIAISNFELTPVVAVTGARPNLTPREAEVSALIEFPVRLLIEGAVSIEEISVPGAVLEIGVYRWAGHRVWGATARTLSMLGSGISGGS
ncbi:MAG: CoA pyrophosphatase [Chloroflexota bacterium]